MRIRNLLGAVSLIIFTASFQAGAAVVNLDDLLKQVKSGRVNDAKENAERIKAFRANKAQQAGKLADMKAERKRQEQRSVKLEKDFDVNEKKLAVLEKTLHERLGNLKELFGVLQQASGDARGQFENSLTQLQFKDRGEFLTELAKKMGQSSKLASIEEIERLWFELQREMTESAKVVRFTARVITAQGEEETRSVTRVGLFNVVSQGKYLQYVPETGNLVELGRQPPGRYLDGVRELEQASSGMVGFAIDPSRGQLLSLLVQSPSLIERIKQGGVVGYIILVLGLIALLVAGEKLINLWLTNRRVNAQVKDTSKPNGNNPLGRVLAVYEANPDANTETLELRLSEAVLKETTGLNRSLMFLKVIAVVAPLMGLLGTVTGMIVTFQAITLFGTGDPKLMAGGISQALVTTVLGLCVAIPTVFLHTMTVIRSKRIIQVLEEQATGMVAERSENEN
ncbi:MAG TPA: energy transducer TonB [Gammaproteobacteria bacterium]|nr:energy transducer TonB [Gammaproteobacteria bacterium]